MAKKKATLMNVSEFSIFNNSKFMAVLYFLIALPIVILMALMALLVPNNKSPFPLWILVLLPFFYALLGFVFSAFAFAIYNWIAILLGEGIEFTVNQK